MGSCPSSAASPKRRISFTAGAALPSLKNLKTFGEGQGKVFRYGNVAIYGSERPDASPESLGMNNEDVNIVMLHGELRQSTGEQISLSRWQNQGVDYLALGHYHSYEAGKLDGRGSYAYAGCPAGRGFDECGEKGFVKLLSIEWVVFFQILLSFLFLLYFSTAHYFFHSFHKCA